MSNKKDEHRIAEFKINPNSEDLWKLQKQYAESIRAIDKFHQLNNILSVTVFSSARTTENDKEYKLIQKIAHLFAKHGYAIITGGGPGGMEAANRGASEVAGSKSVGMNIELPHEQDPNPYSNIKMNFHYFYLRKVFLVRYTDAFLVAPGGFGTLDELFELLTLIQTERMRPRPIVLIGTDFWSGLIDWIKEKMLKEHGYISPEDTDLFVILDKPREIFEFVHKVNKKRKK